MVFFRQVFILPTLERRDMGQQQVMDYLEEVWPKWVDTKELIGALSVGCASLNSCVKRLRETDDVEWKLSNLSANPGPAHYLYRAKQKE